MSGLKLTMAASIYRPYKFVRTTTTTATATTSATTAPAAAKSKLSVAPNSTTDRNSLAYMDRHRISPRAHSGAKAHDKPLGFIRFTFRGHKCFSLSSHNFSSSEEKGGISGSSGLVADMGLEENNNRDHLYENGQRHGSPLLSRNCSDRRNHQPSMQHQNQPESSKLLTLPTILTLGRVAAVPLLVCTFYIDSRWGTTATTSIFIAAAITDWLDGYIARKMRLGSQFGAFLDPVADKLMVAATLVLLCTRPFEVAMFGQVPWLLPIPAIAIIGREITMSAVREWAASQDSKLLEAVAVNNLGKWKTATQMTALTILLATRDSSLGGSGILAASGVSLLYISAWLAVWSLVVYMRKIWKVLLK